MKQYETNNNKITLRRFEISLLFYSIILIILGIIFIIFFRSTIDYFHMFVSGVYEVKILKMYTYLQSITIISMINYIPEGNNKFDELISNDVIYKDMLNNGNNLIKDKQKSVRIFFDTLKNNNEMFYKIYENEVEYFDFDYESSNLLKKKEKFMDFYDRIILSFIDLEDSKNINTNLDISELTFSYDSNLSSLFFILHNILNPFHHYLENNRLLFSKCINDKIEYMMKLIVFYHTFFLLTNFIFFILILFLIKFIFKRYDSNIFFILNLDLEHLYLMNKKYNIILNSLSISTFAHRKLFLLKKETKKTPEKIIAQTQNHHNKVHLNVFKKEHKMKYFIWNLLFLFFTYALTILISILILSFKFNELKIILDYNANFFNDNYNMNAAYIFIKLNKLTTNSLSFFQRVDLIQNNDEIFYYFEKMYDTILIDVIKNENLIKNNSFLESQSLIYFSLNGKNLCDLLSSDKLFSKLENFENIQVIFLEECNQLFSRDESIDLIKFNILNSFRILIYKLNDPNVDKKDAFYYQFKNYSKIMDIFLRPYYDTVKEEYLLPLLENILENLFKTCIYLFVVRVILDVLILLFIKFYLLKKAVNKKKDVKNLLDILIK